MVALLALVAGSGGLATAADEPGPQPDKSQYSLFHPTPRAAMRELSTDRPDQTESPYTVDAGHFQLEMDVVNFSYDRYNPARTDTRVETTSLAAINLKVGLCNQVDFQLGINPYTRIRTEDRVTGTVTHQQGFGDIIPRLKWNLWGNDGGRTALALMPFVKLPANQDRVGTRSVEGGLIVPLAVELTERWHLGVMTELDFIRDGAGDGYHPETVNTLTLGFDFTNRLGGYVEFASTVSTDDDSPWIGTVNTGLTFALTDNIQLDAGINLGVTRSADDFNPFLGFSFRL
jgi:hypothetical protein